MQNKELINKTTEAGFGRRYDIILGESLPPVLFRLQRIIEFLEVIRYEAYAPDKGKLVNKEHYLNLNSRDIL